MTSLRSKPILSWCLYDFANSSYSAVIAAVVFPVYYTKVIVGNEAGLGDLWWGRAISLSMAVVALTSPLIGGIADHGGVRKKFLVSYTLLAVSCVAALAILSPGMMLMGFFLIVLANIGMEGGLVFYNAYLPEIAPPGHMGRVSAWGFGLGYAGSMIALVAALPLVKAQMFGALWIAIALFFLFFSLPMFAWVHDRSFPTEIRFQGFGQAAVRGLAETVHHLREVLGVRRARRFLLAFFLYQDGVGTVIVFSSVFAATTLGFETSELIFVYILVQFMALAGSFVMANPIDLWGPKRVILLSLALWVSVTIIAYMTHTKGLFWGVAAIAGLGLGTVQAASRTFYALIIPPGREAGYFGIYALVGKTSAILGPLVFGTVSRAMGSQRPAILSVALFFVLGGILLAGVGDPVKDPDLPSAE